MVLYHCDFVALQPVVHRLFDLEITGTLLENVGRLVHTVDQRHLVELVHTVIGSANQDSPLLGWLVVSLLRRRTRVENSTSIASQQLQLDSPWNVICRATVELCLVAPDSTMLEHLLSCLARHVPSVDSLLSSLLLACVFEFANGASQLLPAEQRCSALRPLLESLLQTRHPHGLLIATRLIVELCLEVSDPIVQSLCGSLSHCNILDQWIEQWLRFELTSHRARLFERIVELVGPKFPLLRHHLTRFAA